MNQFAAWDDHLIMKQFNFRESHSHMGKGTDLFFPSMPTIRAIFSFHGGFWPPLLVWYRSQITFLTVSLPHKTKAHPWDALSTCSYTSSSFPYYITIQNPVCFFHLRLRCQHLQLWMHSVFGWAGSKQHFISPCCA